MTRLGPDVQAAKDKDSSSWSVSRTAGYAQQMLRILRALHERCQMVFVDVKPGESQGFGAMKRHVRLEPGETIYH